MTKKPIDGVAPEVAAIAAVHDAIKDLGPGDQSRVLNYVALMLNVSPQKFENPAAMLRERNPKNQRAPHQEKKEWAWRAIGRNAGGNKPRG